MPRSNHLSIDEQIRASRMLVPLGAHNYRLARTFLRSALALQMNCNPIDVDIKYLDSGKPFVPNGPEFNLSHCKDLLVVAVAEKIFNGQIGVDVEARITDPDRLRLADKCFTRSERKQLSTFQPGPSQQNAFTRGWTRKEAVVKAIGCGLAAPLESFDVSLEPHNIYDASGLNPERQSLLLASQLKGVSPEYSELYDLGCMLDCEMSLAIVSAGTQGVSVVKVHAVDAHQLMELTGFDHG